MEHLVKNTYNKRVAILLSKINKKTNEKQSAQIKKAVDKIFELGNAVIATSVSSFVSYGVQSEFQMPLIGLLVFYTVFIIGLYFGLNKFLFPKLWNDNAVAREKNNVQIAEKFNTKIIQIFAEINDEISTAESTSDNECRALSLMEALSNLNYVTNFLQEYIFEDKKIIRVSTPGQSSKDFHTEINFYMVEVMLDNFLGLKSRIKKLMNNNYIIGLKGYDLLEKDYKEVCKKIDDLNKSAGR